MTVLLLIISILPVIIIGNYFYQKDLDKEPKIVLLKLFLCGVCSIFMVIYISKVFLMLFPFLEIDKNVDINNFLLLFFKIFFGIALIEEGCKYLMTYCFSYYAKEFDELYDMILYAVFVSLGFACFENILYVYQNGALVGIVRMLTAVPAHAAFGILMGEYLGLARISEKENKLQNKRKKLFLSLLFPTLAHCLYDFLIYQGTFLSITLLIVFIILLYISSFYKIKSISKIGINDKYCLNCGKVANGYYCGFCGKKID